MTDLLTHSSLACARACFRRHELRYELGLVRAEDSEALAIGSLYHAAHHGGIEALDVPTAHPLHREVAARLYVGNLWRWEKEPIEVLQREIAFEVPLINPETGAPSKTWRLAGAIDGIVRLPDGRLAVLEYKTTSSDIALGSDWWIRLRRDAQSSIYWYAARKLGHDVQAVLYDVARRPGIRPRKLSKADVAEIQASGRYCDEDVSDEELGERETPRMYGARVTLDIGLDPGSYFVRAEVARPTSELEATQRDLWRWGELLRDAARTGCWPRNPDSCVWPRRCDYFDVCDRTDLNTNTPSGMVRLSDPHPELARARLVAQPMPAGG